ncbi:Alpha-xylosidase BoGH31A (plasmid) [Asticcacaulis sp. MM231]
MQTPKPLALNRRHVLMAGAATAAAAFSVGDLLAVTHSPPDFVSAVPGGSLEVIALTDRAFRVRFVPSSRLAEATSSILLAQASKPRVRVTQTRQGRKLRLLHLICDWNDQTETLSFLDASGKVLLQESARRLTPSTVRGQPTFVAEQTFQSPADERLFGTGCFQDGYLNIRGLPRRLTQVNTQISLPFVLSSKGYGLLWHNTGMSELNPPSRPIALKRVDVEAKVESANVTTAGGNAQVMRRMATYTGRFDVEETGRFAFMLDIGRKMASRHYVEIDGVACCDFSNLWLPPTASFITDLSAGSHDIKVVANEEDAPSLRFDPVRDQTVWRSTVANSLDYVVIAGPEAAEVMAGYRALTGETPMMPLWAYGYIHCRERFHSSDEILETAAEFRKRKLPVDIMVQDWQYWGKHGWNAMQFDEDHYPDPAALVRNLHGMDMRFMLSVWSKISRDTLLGKEVERQGFYIPKTDWVDFFNPKAAAFYWQNQSQKLAALGIDAWWQDATEPENDDLDGRETAGGAGERVRLIYPVQVARTVYEGHRRDFPDRRVMVLTRSAFLGQQRYAAATWSGDIGHDWETLKRQIPAGLNMAAAGYPYWTVDAGGFFRPGEGQYSDPAYHERFIRWFQYATFLPLQRVHGYMTNTEFWRYGDTVETLSRAFLELRYRLLPYTYSLAAATHRTGTPIIRPLVFDFAHDPQALDQSHSYMFGSALHVAPVLEPGVARWPVYLPQRQGGWFDAWSGERRAGGQRHDIATPIDHIPLHMPAGAIIPLGPVVQSTANIRREDIDLFVCPGQDGAFTLYEDDGLTYDYEKKACARIPMSWNEVRRHFTIGDREGQFPGMLETRRFRVHLVGPEQTPLAFTGGVVLDYNGTKISVTLPK